MATKKPKLAKLTSSWRLLPQSYQLFLDNARPSILVIIVPTLLVQLGSTLLLVTNRPAWHSAAIILQSMGFVLLAVNAAASILLQLQVAQKRKIDLYQLYYDSFGYLLRLIGLSLLLAFILLIGFMLFIIPGLILLQRYILAPYFLIGENLGIREAMQRSAAASKPVAKHIWTMVFILIGFSALGFAFSKLSPEYGGFLTLLLPVIYSYLPVLRYQEAVQLTPPVEK